MPGLGEIRKAQEIGKLPVNSKYIWHACEFCGKKRWVHILRGQPHRKRCKGCANKGRIVTKTTKLKQSRSLRRNPDTKFKDKSGYVWVHCYRDSEYYPMSNIRNLVLEHRLVMAKHLGRCLTSREHIHHRNGDKADNRIENLELISRANHNMVTVFCHNCEIKRKNKQLRLQNRQLLEQIGKINLS